MSDLPFSPAANRNKHAILDVLKRVLPDGGRMLEVASGTGQHAAWLGMNLRGWEWQPTEVNSAALPTISAWARQAGAPNVKPPCLLNAIESRWPADEETLASAFALPFDAMYCANMLHIAPWSGTLGLMAGATRHLAPGGLLLVYGPFLEEGVAPAPSNLEFDASLRAQNHQWGLRQRSAIETAARQAGMEPVQRFEMPANNLMLVFQRPHPAP
jgi:SAM-dependent methyltransferase